MWEFEKSVKEHFKNNNIVGAVAQKPAIEMEGDDLYPKTILDNVGIYNDPTDKTSNDIIIYRTDIVKDAYVDKYLKSNDSPTIGLKEASTAIELCQFESDNSKMIMNAVARTIYDKERYEEKKFVKNKYKEINKTAWQLYDVIKKAGNYVDKACSKEYRRELVPSEKRELDRSVDKYSKALTGAKRFVISALEKVGEFYGIKAPEKALEKINEKQIEQYNQSLSDLKTSVASNKYTSVTLKTAITQEIDRQQKQIDKSIGLGR